MKYYREVLLPWLVGAISGALVLGIAGRRGWRGASPYALRRLHHIYDIRSLCIRTLKKVQTKLEEILMRKVIEVSPFVLLIVGTLGLLANEFILDWGTLATLIFAVSNVIGLILLGIASWSKTKDK